jgi:hypothetical protein
MKRELVQTVTMFQLPEQTGKLLENQLYIPYRVLVQNQAGQLTLDQGVKNRSATVHT